MDSRGIMKLKAGLVLLLVLVTHLLYAQSTRVRGKVIDAETGEVLPLANVFFKGTTIGVTTDFEGTYYLETRENVVELEASLLGYTAKIVKINPGAYNTVDFALEPEHIALDEVKVTPGENPAHAVLRNVIRNKYRNNPAFLDRYVCKPIRRWNLT